MKKMFLSFLELIAKFTQHSMRAAWFRNRFTFIDYNSYIFDQMWYSHINPNYEGTGVIKGCAWCNWCSFKGPLKKVIFSHHNFSKTVSYTAKNPWPHDLLIFNFGFWWISSKKRRLTSQVKKSIESWLFTSIYTMNLAHMIEFWISWTSFMNCFTFYKTIDRVVYFWIDFISNVIETKTADF